MSALTAVHLPLGTEVTLADAEAGAGVRADSCSVPGILLRGDILVYVHGVHVQSHAHAKQLLDPNTSHPILSDHADKLRMLVKRVPIVEFVLKRPMSGKFGLIFRSTLDGGSRSGAVELAHVDPAGAVTQTDRLAVGGIVASINGQDIIPGAGAENRVSAVLRNLELGGEARIVMHHPPRVKPNLLPVPGDFNASLRSCNLPTRAVAKPAFGATCSPGAPRDAPPSPVKDAPDTMRPAVAAIRDASPSPTTTVAHDAAMAVLRADATTPPRKGSNSLPRGDGHETRKQSAVAGSFLQI